MITYRSDLAGIDWAALKQDLVADDFHNGRTTSHLKLSFENSAFVAMAHDGDRCIGNGRLLSDGVGNAYVIDVWTQSTYRLQGIARKIMQMLTAAVPGQHLYLQTDNAVDFYGKLGFVEQPKGMRFIASEYLQNETRDQ